MIKHYFKVPGPGHGFAFALPFFFSIYLMSNSVNDHPQQKCDPQNEMKDSQPLKSFEGYYQLQEDTNTYLQIAIKGNNLTLKQLWDGKKITFERKSDLEFFNQDESFPLRFSKDQEGSITQVLAFDKDLWKKAHNYPPLTQKEIHLSAQQLKTFEGKYEFQFEKGENSFLQITANDDHIVLKQLWDNKEIKFVPKSDLEFFCKEQSFPLKFIKDKNGQVIQMLAFNRDLWEKVKE